MPLPASLNVLLTNRADSSAFARKVSKMLIVRKKGASEEQQQQVKQYLVDHDFDFHQSTGANRTIIGVIGDTESVNRAELENQNGVHVIFKIPEENDG